MTYADDDRVIATEGQRARRRPCARCGTALASGHGNQRYHQECGARVKAERQRKNAAAYRARRAGDSGPTVPDDFDAGRVSVPGVVLPGARTAAIRLAASQTTLAARAFHESLKPLGFEEVLNNPQLMALRSFVDEVIGFLEVVDDSLPIPQLRARSISPKDGLEAAIVHRIKVRGQRS